MMCDWLSVEFGGHVLFIPSAPHSFRRRRSLHKPPRKPRSKSWRTCHSGTHARARRARQRATTGSLSRFLTGRRCLWHISGRHSLVRLWPLLDRSQVVAHKALSENGAFWKERPMERRFAAHREQLLADAEVDLALLRGVLPRRERFLDPF